MKTSNTVLTNFLKFKRINFESVSIHRCSMPNALSGQMDIPNDSHLYTQKKKKGVSLHELKKIKLVIVVLLSPVWKTVSSVSVCVSVCQYAHKWVQGK